MPLAWHGVLSIALHVLSLVRGILFFMVHVASSLCMFCGNHLQQFHMTTCPLESSKAHLCS